MSLPLTITYGLMTATTGALVANTWLLSLPRLALTGLNHYSPFAGTVPQEWRNEMDNLSDLRTNDTPYWELYSDALHGVTVHLNTMMNRLAWISDTKDSFKSARGSDRREQIIKTVRDELRDVCNRNYRDIQDALSKLEGMVGVEQVNEQLLAETILSFPALNVSAGEANNG